MLGKKKQRSGRKLETTEQSIRKLVQEEMLALFQGASKKPHKTKCGYETDDDFVVSEDESTEEEYTTNKKKRVRRKITTSDDEQEEPIITTRNKVHCYTGASGNTWEFELDADPLSEQTAMNYRWRYGKYKGLSYGEVMKTEKGRKYMDWFLTQKNSEKDPIRSQRIQKCFDVYHEYIKQQTL